MSASELENAVRKIEGFGEKENRCKIEEIHSVFTEDAHDHLILRKIV
jgi:CRISPR/Cas system-associated protein Cas5 (RAMP superfamily)